MRQLIPYILLASLLLSCNNRPTTTRQNVPNSEAEIPSFVIRTPPPEVVEEEEEEEEVVEPVEEPKPPQYALEYLSHSYGVPSASATFESVGKIKELAQQNKNDADDNPSQENENQAQEKAEQDPNSNAENTSESKGKDDLDDTAEEEKEETVELPALKLNLYDAGEDCLTLVFKLTVDGKPMDDQDVTFKSQTDYPSGAKFGIRILQEETEVDPTSGKPYLVFDAVTSEDGLVSAPVCAGFQGGTLSITAVYTDDSGAVHEAKAPDLNIDGGVANYGFTSLTFDTENSRSIYSSLLTNEEQPTPFKLVVKSKDNNAAVTTHKVQVAVETGFSAQVDSQGTPNEFGEVSFTLQSLGLASGKPYTVYPEFITDVQSNNPKWPVDCDPFFVDPASSPIDYAKLAYNWRGTMIYYVTGQEFFNDANGNGKFDGNNGDGFWDKNQNGIWDGPEVDELTFDYNDNETFDMVDADGAPLEWFIDIPSPYVDANENNTWDAFETTIGETYTKPNGKWDRKTLIWKSVTLPLYFGMSVYSVQRNQLSHKGVSPKITPETVSYLQSVGQGSYINASQDEILSQYRFGDSGMYQDFGMTLDGSNELVPTTDATGSSYFLYAKEVCGGPLPGGTSIAIDFETIKPADFGDRPFVGEFAIQPGDEGRPKGRRLFKSAEGNQAIVNFNIVEHPSSVAGYPFKFSINLLGCSNPIQGAVSDTPGIVCDAKTVRAKVTFTDKRQEGLTLSQVLSVPLSGNIAELQSTHCAPGAALLGDTCVCAPNTEYNATTRTCDPQ